MPTEISLIIAVAAVAVAIVSAMWSRDSALRSNALAAGSLRVAQETKEQSATQEYVKQLEARISECEIGRRELRDENVKLRDRYDQLRDENRDLRIKVLEVEARMSTDGAALDLLKDATIMRSPHKSKGERQNDTSL